MASHTQDDTTTVRTLPHGPRQQDHGSGMKHMVAHALARCAACCSPAAGHAAVDTVGTDKVAQTMDKLGPDEAVHMMDVMGPKKMAETLGRE